MDTLFGALAQRLSEGWKHRAAPRAAERVYRCRCGRPIFFANSKCLGCGAELGYAPDLGAVLALDPGSKPDTWRVEGSDAIWRRCGNFTSPAGCNWLIRSDDDQPLCRACRLNRTIPDLSDPANADAWRKIERAKRRLVAQLLALGLPVRSKVTEDPEHGLAFDFLRSPESGPRVLTGHDSGLITLNVEEADDAVRERIRQEMREPYRTLLGHFRHEVGHYYWDRLIADTDRIEPFRALFGDERADYAAALKRNYEEGPPADWARHFVSAYASIHPWEDWAETWAHYLHMVDTLGTALAFGISAEDLELDAEPFTAEALYAPDDRDAASFLYLLNSWVELTAVLNELARSMGQRDFYPFVMPRPAVAKLQFIAIAVRDGRSRA
jgi:hypothetical protein